MAENKQDLKCLNCGMPISTEDKYCPHCGQEVIKVLPSIKFILKDFIGNALSLDNKLFRTLIGLCIPGRMAKEYVAGKRIKYFSPSRSYFFLLFIIIALFSTIQRKSNSNGFLPYARLIEANDIRTDIANLDTSFIDKQCKAQIDSLIFEDETDLHCIEFTDISSGDGVQMNLTKADINAYDALTLDFKELDRKYQFNGWREKIITKQSIRIFKNPETMLVFYIGNLVWGLFLVIFLHSFFLRLLYYRSRHYTVEHMVLGLYQHSFMFLLALIYIMNSYVLNHYSGSLLCLLLILYIIHYLFTRKLYYEQGWIKTVLKCQISSLVYMFLIVVIIVLILFVSFALY